MKQLLKLILPINWVYLMTNVMKINPVKIFVNQENTIGNMKSVWFVQYVVNVLGIASAVLVVFGPIENLASKLYTILSYFIKMYAFRVKTYYL